MVKRVLVSAAAALIVAIGVVKFVSVPVVGQRPAEQAAAPSPVAPAKAANVKTEWGEPDLQGIWMPEFLTPLQRPEWVGDRALFTEQERQALDDRRTKRLGRDFRATKGTVADVAGA